MSRTFRRKNGDPWDKKWHVSDYIRIPGTHCYQRIYYEQGSDEYKKGLARYHSDAGTTNCKEPGPSWFRNLYTQRPHRRHADIEIRKFILNDDYEPMIGSKDKLEYWT